MWGNNTSDWMYAPCSRYSTVAWSNDSHLSSDASVISLSRPPGRGGQQTYTFTDNLDPGLTYNDARPIGARDNVSRLLQARRR
jgi:hypothetical protein